MKLPLKTCYVCVLWILSTLGVFSQTNNSNQYLYSQNLYNNTTGQLAYTGNEKEETFQSSITKIKGSQFYDEEFEKATISDSKNMFNVRYNAFLDEMEIIDGDKIMFINKNFQKHLISFTEKKLAFRVLKEKDDNVKETLGYFVTLEENELISLHRKDRKKYVRSSRSFAHEKGKFQNVRSSFYLERNNSGIVIAVPKKKKEFLALFPDKAEQINIFIKENRIKLNKEKSLIKLIRYINTI